MQAPANDSESRERYDTWHAGLDADEATSPWHDMIRAQLDPRRDLEGRTVLEIGCGRGAFSLSLAREAKLAEQVAMDFSQVAVDRGRERAAREGLPGITWELGDIQAITRGDATFDTVFSCETIEHVPEPARAVSELARVLKPGGRLFLTTPNYANLMGVYRGYLRLRGRRFTEVGQPINQFTLFPRTIAWVRRAGLRILDLDAVGHYVPVPGRPPVRLSALDGARPVTRWFGHHSMVVATKP
jgi:2-polyprenyl-3-methyl-5-hydroxy-6-metoxy-1,4-benzoquinol methylase